MFTHASARNVSVRFGHVVWLKKGGIGAWASTVGTEEMGM